MMAVAVITGGDGGGDGRFAEGHGLAVVSVAIMFEAIFVAFAATLIAHHLEVTILRGFNAVRGVAIGAHRAALVALRQ